MNLGLVLVLVGLVVALVSALANVLGLGHYPGFGWKKTLGVVVGIVLMGLGWFWRR